MPCFHCPHCQAAHLEKLEFFALIIDDAETLACDGRVTEACKLVGSWLSYNREVYQTNVFRDFVARNSHWIMNSEPYFNQLG
jgi:hypothetical protein